MTKYGRFLAVLSLLFLGFVASSLASANSSPLNQPLSLDPPPLLQTQPVSPTETALDVFITEEGIFPPVLTVLPGTTIQWTNQTSQTQHLEGANTSGPTLIYLPLIFKDSTGVPDSSPVNGEVPAPNNLPGQETTWQSGDLPVGDSFSRTFDQPGEYSYLLTNSPTLSGTIVVAPQEFAHAVASIIAVTAKTDDRTPNGNCTLREAVIAANTNKAVDKCPAGNSVDIIVLESGTYSLTLTGKNEDSATTGDLDITNYSNITITGTGETIINAQALSDRVFQVFDWGKLTLSDVTVSQGQGFGGGIYNRGTLTLNRSTLSNNSASGTFGGGLKNEGYVTLNDSTISGNTATFGGGIYNRGILNVNNSTVSSNNASSMGGGLKSDGTVILKNTTVSSNTAEYAGGLRRNFGTIKFQNSIVAGNIASKDPAHADCDNMSSGSLGFNLVGNGTGCPTTADNTDLKIDPTQIFAVVLDPLQDNGGNTLTHALLPNSPAIDAGNPNGCKDSSGNLLTNDQRGEKRPVDGDGKDGPRCDIGAYEAKLANPTQTSPYVININSDTNDGVCTQANCSLREAINAANAHPNNGDKPDEIRFSIPISGLQTIQLTSTLVITEPLIIDGTTQPGATCDPLNPLIKLDGANAGPTADGLSITGGNSTIRGLIISNFKGDGIELSGSGNNIIRCNIITNNGDPVTNNGGAGIRVSTSIGNAIGGTGIISDVNHIADNADLGIDLGGDGVTPNDAGDPDIGPNNLQNFPVLTGAFPDDGSTRIEGRLNSTAVTTFTLEFFVNPTCDTADFGEGQTLLGTTSLKTDESGDAIFTNTVSFSGTIPLGQFVTATATDANGNTSEFSQCAPASLDNDTWPRAFALNVSSGSASFDQFLDKEGQSRWYKFSVQPNSQAIVTLTNLPENYDLTLYKDIDAVFKELTAPNVQDLVQLNAEFATDAFASDAVARGVRSPDAYARGVRSPDAFSATAFTPDAVARGVRSPDAVARGVRSPDSFAPDAFAADAYTPDAFARGVRSDDAFARGVRSPEVFSSAQTRSLIGISAFEGTASEGLFANTWNNTGDFYIRVRGRNGAFSLAQQFHLEVTLVNEICKNVSAAGLPATSLAATDGDFNTIILTDLSRMGGADVATMTLRLNTFAARPEVRGAVVDVGADARVSQANIRANANPACPYAKNLVAEAIKDVINAYRALNPLQYVVIVGNDDVIPFFRHPDRALLGPESDYVPPVFDDTASQASLKLNYTLGQDFYGSQIDLSFQVSTLPIPDLAVGRLVESPTDIINVLEAYLSLNTPGREGVVTPSTAPTSTLVTGYDFFADAAVAIQSELEDGLGIARGSADTLITARTVSPLDPDDPNIPNDPFAWTAAQLSAKLLDSPHDLVFLGGHFSANSALAADYQTRLLATELDASTVDLRNALIYSIGCHSGYNIVNEHGIPNVTLEPDWAQAFARKGATFIAGTGYQYGDTDFIEYSERLYLEFSRQLRTGSPGEGVSVGQALVKAKQIYLAQTPQFRPLHEKSLLEATLFGLPMLKIDLPVKRSNPSPGVSLVPAVDPFGTDPGKTLRLGFKDITLGPITISQSTVQLEDVEDGSTFDAISLTGKDGTVTNPLEPALPLEVHNVTGPNTLVLRGVGFRGGSYTDIPGVRPLIGVPTTEIRGVHIPFVSDIFYPVQPWSVNYFDALAEGSAGVTRLAVTPAQFKSTSPVAETSTLRQFENMSFRLYYSDNTDSFGDAGVPALAAAPVIANVSAPLTPGGVNFRIRVIGDPLAGIQEVWITYTVCPLNGVCNGTWQYLPLARNATDSTLWEENLSTTTPQDIRYIVQAVNGVGLVSMATNLGAYYIPGVDVTTLDPTGLSLVTPAPTSGPYGTEVTFSAVLTRTAVLTGENDQPLVGEVVLFGLGAQSGLGVTDGNGRATVTLPLLGTPGDYQVQAAFPGSANNAASAAPNPLPFTITKQDTFLCLERPADSTDTGCQPQPISGLASNDPLVVATLTDTSGQGLFENNQRLFEKTVVFVVTGGGRSYTQTVITDFLGRASLGRLPLPPGDYDLRATFNITVPVASGRNISLNDPRYNSTTATAKLTLENPSPVANHDSAITDEDTAVTINVLANDTDSNGDTLTVASVTQGVNGSVTNNGANVTYTPNPNFNGTDTFTYRASDGNSNSNEATVTVTVNPVNDAPVANNDVYTVTEKSKLIIAAPGVLANDTDIDGNTLTAVRPPVTGPISGTLTLNADGSFTYTPNVNFYGTDTFTYRANDGTVDSNVATVTITVKPSICSTATANPVTIWPPNKDLWVPESVNVSNSVAVTITGIFQDELGGNGKYSPDGIIIGQNSAQVRAERDGKGDGRVYHIFFTAKDGQGVSCSGEVRAAIVPHDQGEEEEIDKIDGGPLCDSRQKGCVPPPPPPSP